jgi:hypothetical protein
MIRSPLPPCSFFASIGPSSFSMMAANQHTQHRSAAPAPHRGDH